MGNGIYSFAIGSPKRQSWWTLMRLAPDHLPVECLLQPCLRMDASLHLYPVLVISWKQKQITAIPQE